MNQLACLFAFFFLGPNSSICLLQGKDKASWFDELIVAKADVQEFISVTELSGVMKMELSEDAPNSNVDGTFFLTFRNDSGRSFEVDDIATDCGCVRVRSGVGVVEPGQLFAMNLMARPSKVFGAEIFGVRIHVLGQVEQLVIILTRIISSPIAVDQKSLSFAPGDYHAEINLSWDYENYTIESTAFERGFATVDKNFRASAQANVNW